MRKVLILTQKKGWHYYQLKNSFEKSGFVVVSADLEDLSIKITNLTIDINKFINNFSDVTDVFVRHVPGGSLEEVVHSLNILKIFQEKNINIMNTSEHIETTVDKSMTSIKLKQASILTPNTWVLRGKEKSIQTVKNILEKHPLIYKPLFGSQGDNIVKINSLKDFENIDNHNNIFYLQEFLETSPSHDYRVLVIKKNNHKYIYSMMRLGKNYINNISKGAECIPVKPDSDVIDTAIKSVEAINIPFSGVDIIKHQGKNYVIEMNSVPAWRGIQSLYKQKISDYIVKVFAENNKVNIALQK